MQVTELFTPLYESPEKWIKAYRAENAGRGVKTDAIQGGVYFFPKRSQAELWAGGHGNVIEREIRVDNASYQAVPEGEATRNAPVIVRTDPERNGQMLEIIVFDKNSVRPSRMIQDDRGGLGSAPAGTGNQGVSARGYGTAGAPGEPKLP